MSLHKDLELKEAVLNLSQKEKDKLLVRLVGKDKMLMKQLHFRLLESEVDLTERIENLKRDISNLFRSMKRGSNYSRNYSLDKDLSAHIRHANGLVNEHEKITKDKFSDVECRLLILNDVFERYPGVFEKDSYYASPKLLSYVQARVRMVVPKYEKLHEDFQFDLRDQFQKMMDFAVENNLD
ncbi:hypothetical protein [Sphingobacterium sp. JB170]|uniref:hypothetical protein n=1 Tax=Sphingobacterium sp. JB170 TaxID=1434842 RepID=UPI00097F11C9|nr:hypothetical protein [Sphingobacterium sp. JB170]SJN16326.1 hypothetical protein FM107_00490 [Sphingobacterium sp. JB170]